MSMPRRFFFAAVVWAVIYGSVLPAVAAVADTSTLKEPCTGTMIRDYRGGRLPSYIDSVVVQVGWRDLESVDQRFDGPGWAQIEAARRQCLKIRLRIFAGVRAPDFVKQIGGPGLSAPEHQIDCARSGGVAIWNNWDQRGGAVPRFWLPEVLDQYEQLMTEVARRYDEAPEICEVVETACMTLYAEPFYRAHRDTPSNARLSRAGLNFEKDRDAHRRALQIHERLFRRTRTSLAINSWDIIDDSPTHHRASFEPVAELVDWARDLMGERLVLQNNGTGIDARCPDGATRQTNHFCYLRKAAKPKGFQTRTWKRLGGTEAGLFRTLDFAVAMGANFVELPGGFQRADAERLKQYSRRLRENWVSGEQGSGRISR